MKQNYELLIWLGLFYFLPFSLLSQDVPQDILDINPNVLPESTYPYWPSYNYLEFSDVQNIEAQLWNASPHTVDGWDWSLPNDVIPASNSLIALQRNIYFKDDGSFKDFDAPKLQFEGNPVGLLWVKWRDLEKVEGQIDFSTVIGSIQQANSQGVDIVLRILAHSKERGNGVDGEAPLWLEDLGASLLPRDKTSDNLNFDPSDPIFHAQYLELVNALAESGIPQMVKAAYVGYASHSFGDEGIGPHGEKEWEKNDAETHVRERLDAWQNAFDGIEHKVFMGGTSHYGFDYGFGVRRGFVEMYLYNIPNHDLGQSIDEDGYLILDESSPIVSHGGFHGEVNEEYEPAWATPERGYRFGATTNSFTYRYFISNLRALQMRCSYIHTTGHLMPQMLPFIAQELGRTVEDTPDVWTYLGTSYMDHKTYKNNDTASPKRSFTKTEKNEGIEMKNFERWLYQRDAEGYTTTPDVQIQQSIKMWMVFEDKYYDYIARKGAKIGFDIDDRWLKENRLAIKVTYFDEGEGNLVLKSNAGEQKYQVALTGDGELKTTTFIVSKMQANSMDHNFDFTLEADQEGNELVVSMVRAIKLNDYLFEDGEIKEYYGPVGAIEIPSTINNMTVTSIGVGAFRNSGLTSVTLPSTLQEIKEEAFYGNDLDAVELPNNLLLIGQNAFLENNFTSITLPSTILDGEPTDVWYGSNGTLYARNTSNLETSYEAVPKAENTVLISVEFENGSGSLLVEGPFESTYPLLGVVSFYVEEGSLVTLTPQLDNLPEGFYAPAFVIENVTEDYLKVFDFDTYLQESVQTFSISYYTDGGEHTNVTQYNSNSETIVLTDASKEGFHFEGWFNDSDFEEQILEITTGTTGDLTLYAKFSIAEYSINYNDGGTHENPLNYTILSEINLLDPQKDNYKFMGWFMDEEFTQPISSIEKGNIGDLTLYAKWKLSEITSIDPLLESITLYPNPANEYLRINQEVDQLTIYTINGIQVKHFGQSQSHYKLSDLPPGVYHVVLLIDDQKLTKKLIIK
ncbi:InlB B-repeat-containing protein [Flammeovirga sp. EKP202]|uniref:InlB B-repeat-containing protein n=1 Tax=Flammeovirga sp. EKP202 TaxID=2770592 RepID=UPI00165F708A|nr:InlB B-repeat-containing protein [Flammeovirga sp. EKP202]MBD0401910.1 InlB B-repeat-containing protein [Flammeovirga sp. EKP202]